MAGAILHYFRFGEKGSTPLNNAPTLPAPVRALPASWYNSPEMYDFERRAIFSRRWLFMTHTSRLKNSGDFLRYTVAGFDFIIARDRTGTINAYHNVCRHRAYPVVEKSEGNAKILACKYHGWSYSLSGKLAKAPGYKNFSDFESEQNSLFRIHVKVDRMGFIWINMDAKPEPEVPWEEHFANMDAQERYKAVDFDSYEFDHAYSLECEYNWKIAADNFNECYHCPTSHPDIPALMNPDISFDYQDKAVLQDPAAMEEATRSVNSSYFFPNGSLSVSPHMIMIQKFLPRSATSMTILYEIYRNTHSSPSDFKLVADTYARVMSEDKDLCKRAQDNLNAGVFQNGQLHPKFEKAPLAFQDTCRKVVTEWFEREKKERKAIWPARQIVKGGGNEGNHEEDEAICRGIVGMCTGEKEQQAVLAW